MQAVRSDSAATTPSALPEEIARFSALASQWWDPNGPMRPLHRMNRLRVDWIDRRLGALSAARPGSGLRVLDLGCGAGLASEALAARGHDVLGVDASEAAITAACAHQAITEMSARLRGSLCYRVGGPETLVREGLRFDAVVALEVIEHVTDPAAFLVLLRQLLAPGGVIVVSTINRTWRSLAVAKIGAEYILKMLPVGTHEWRKFVTPAELGRHAGQAGLRIRDIAGMTLSMNGWRESRDTAINYIALISGS